MRAILEIDGAATAHNRLMMTHCFHILACDRMLRQAKRSLCLFLRMEGPPIAISCGQILLKAAAAI